MASSGFEVASLLDAVSLPRPDGGSSPGRIDGVDKGPTVPRMYSRPSETVHICVFCHLSNLIRNFIFIHRWKGSNYCTMYNWHFKNFENLTPYLFIFTSNAKKKKKIISVDVKKMVVSKTLNFNIQLIKIILKWGVMCRYLLIDCMVTIERRAGMASGL